MKAQYFETLKQIEATAQACRMIIEKDLFGDRTQVGICFMQCFYSVNTPYILTEEELAHRKVELSELQNYIIETDEIESRNAILNGLQNIDFDLLQQCNNKFVEISVNYMEKQLNNECSLYYTLRAVNPKCSPEKLLSYYYNGDDSFLQTELYTKYTSFVVRLMLDVKNWLRLITTNIQTPNGSPNRFFKCTRSTEEIQRIFRELKEVDFLPTDAQLDAWEYICTGEPQSTQETPIIWAGNNTDLAMLIEELFAMDERKWEKAAAAFILLETKQHPIAKTLRQSRSKIHYQKPTEKQQKLLQILKKKSEP